MSDAKYTFISYEGARKTWEQQYKCKIVREIVSQDKSENYETDAAHVFELDNKQFMAVIERGCSCYDYSDADVTICDCEAAALEIFKKAVE